MSFLQLKTLSMHQMVYTIENQVNALNARMVNSKNSFTDISRDMTLLIRGMNLLVKHLIKLEKEIHIENTENCIKMKNQLTSVINDFYTIEDEISSRDDICIDDMARLVEYTEEVTGVLKNIEDSYYFDTIVKMESSIEYIERMGKANEIDDPSNMKLLVEKLFVIVNDIVGHSKKLLSATEKEHLVLYVHQLSSSYTVLVNIVQMQHQDNLPIFNAKKYACERICSCFRMIIDLFRAKYPITNGSIDRAQYDFILECDHIDGVVEDSLIYKIDIITQLLSIVNSMRCNETKLNQVSMKLWAYIEDILSHAMMIAQLCDPNYRKVINEVCQSTLEEFNKVKREMQCNLSVKDRIFVTTLINSLNKIEKVMNISVFSLLTDVFSDPFNTLKNLIKKCKNPSTTEQIRTKQDLDNDIQIFDEIIEKIIQIGFYAMASCNDMCYAIDIKSHLANLESLQSVLIPSIISFYLDPTNAELRSNAKFLTTQWQSTVNQLRSSLNIIIDPITLCQTLYDNLECRLTQMLAGIRQNDIKFITKRARYLITYLTVGCDDTGMRTSSMLMMTQQLKEAIYELQEASKDLLEDEILVDQHQQLRIRKRCELLVQEIKHIQAELVVTTDSYDRGQSRLYPIVYRDISQGENKIASSIERYAADHLSHIQQREAKASSADCSSLLIPYIEKARQLRNGRTAIICSTASAIEKSVSRPIHEISKIQSFHQFVRNLTGWRQHMFCRSNLPHSRNDADISTENWNLTTLIDEWPFVPKMEH